MIHVYELSELIFLLVERLRQPSKYDSTGVVYVTGGRDWPVPPAVPLSFQSIIKYSFK